ncbi:MAG: class A beta-lactamase [Burkholderiaceae bacterium]|nr:class A beta-lactamase [Burkholderiaceae bacterium]
MKNDISGCRAMLAMLCLGGVLASPCAYALDTEILANAVQREAQLLNARVGMAVIDTLDGRRWNLRGDERFPLNSTHKTFTCAALLHQVDKGVLSLSQVVVIRPSQRVGYSPVTEKHLPTESMTLQALCEAAVSFSDNTAANLVTSVNGGPSALTTFLRGLGDSSTRLDRLEPELNSAVPNDERDTTTPNAIVDDLKKLLLGEVLTPKSRALLEDWMINDKVADALLRAALPVGWKIADKSGAGGYGSRSIVAVIWPPHRAPVVVGIYITQTLVPMTDSNAAIERIGAALVAAIQQ